MIQANARSLWSSICRGLLIVLGCAMLVGCQNTSLSPTPPVSSQQSGASQDNASMNGENVSPQPTQPSDTGWQLVGEGVEVRHMKVEQNGALTPVHLARFDPTVIRFRVGYAPDTPQGMRSWCRQSGALAAINGGFFEPNYQTTALLVSEKVAHGTSYSGMGGMFAVDVYGNVSLRYLVEIPYNPNETLQTAIQGWPMLIVAGGRYAYTNAGNGERARRSVIATDQYGHVLFLAFPGSSFTLHHLTRWLLQSDLAIDTALNLDGGSSTGMCVQSGEYQEFVDSFALLPTVLFVDPR